MDDYYPLIFINSTDSEYGKVFSILHEFIHHWSGNKQSMQCRRRLSFNCKTAGNFL
ncbi:MAG: ImmA/IrrE family metallo-endopeptidase [Deltaproteobacteria bacterium]|nr:ImmA/IrrE family metallo-endopeptidase [Deltaproteobacteria bacterium]